MEAFGQEIVGDDGAINRRVGRCRASLMGLSLFRGSYPGRAL